LLRDDRLVVTAERHSQLPQERERLVILVRRGDEGDVHSVDLLDHVVVDLREDHLLLDAERVVPASIEGAGVDAAEVADARDRHRDEPVEELPHPRAAKRHRGTDLLALSQSEVRNRLLRFLPNRTLAGDDAQLEHDGVENLGILDRFADAAVDHDLLERRDLIDVGESELVLQPVANRLLVVQAETRRRDWQILAGMLGLDLSLNLFLFPLLLLFGCHLSEILAQRTRGIGSPFLTLTRSLVLRRSTFDASVSNRECVLVGSPDLGSRSMTLEAWIDAGASRIPDCSSAVRAL